MNRSLSSPLLDSIRARLDTAAEDLADWYPGDPVGRQPVHTVYGGAHLFRADSRDKLGRVARRVLEDYAGNFALFARALRLRGHERLPEVPTALEATYAKDPKALRRSDPDAWAACTLYERVLRKLDREPVEDFRLDFEDGYGHRPDEEEDACAVAAAHEMAKGMEQNTLPPYIGIRIKPLSREWAPRAIRTLDLFLTALAARTKGALPSHFVVTLPKVVVPQQVAALVDLFEALESQLGIERGTLRLEIMVETPQSLAGADGSSPLAGLVDAARGRCVAAHFGVYDYTAGLGIAASHQTMQHPACDHARQVIQVALAGRRVWLSDGATNVLPVAVHRAKEDQPLTAAQLAENHRAVHHAWRTHFADVLHSLTNGYYQGWDLHPAQLPTRYAALYSFFLGGLERATARLRGLIAHAGQGTLVGDVFDDAASGQGLLNFFARGLRCGAITETEAGATGLSFAEIASRSVLQIVEQRRRGGTGKRE